MMVPGTSMRMDGKIIAWRGFLNELTRGMVWLLMTPMLAFALPATEDRIGFSIIKTASSAGTQEALVVESGSWFTRRHLWQNAVLITHPKGDILIDTGLGREVDQQFAENSFFDRQLFGYEDLDPAADQMQRNNYDINQVTRIIPTHLHWDHASGIKDFPFAEVWVQRAEYDEAIHGKPPVHLLSQIDDPAIKWHFVELDTVPYEGFSKSVDVYGDGSIVLVDLSGHSAGQLGIFLRVSSGKRYFFSGDTTWTFKGVKDNAQRSGIIRWLVDVNWDTEKNTMQIEKLHQLNNNEASVQIIPAHDELVAKTLPRFPEFGY